MKRYLVTGIVIALSLTSALPARSNPALVAPAAGLCGTGIGCVFVGTVIIGGVLYYVYIHQGQKVYVPTSANNNRLESRAISGEQAHRRGDAHWSNTIEGCYKIGKRISKKPKEHPPAMGGGFWCIFPGEQTSFGED